MMMTLHRIVYFSLFINLITCDQGYYDIIYKQLNSVLNAKDIEISRPDAESVNKLFNADAIVETIDAAARSPEDDLGSFDNSPAGPPPNTPSFSVLSLLNGLNTARLAIARAQANISEACWNHTNAMLQGITSRKPWAMQMLDSFGLPNSIVMTRLTNKWVGKYEGCQGISTEDFDSQFCVSRLNITMIPDPTTQKMGLIIYHAVCMPNTCSSVDISTLLSAVVYPLTNKQIYALPGACAKPEIPYDTRAIVAVSVVSVIAALMIVGTVYDVLNQHCTGGKKNSSNHGGNAEKYKLGQENGGFEHSNGVIIDHKKTDHGHQNGNTVEFQKNGISTISDTDDKLKLKDPSFQMTVDTVQTKNDGPGTLGKLLLAFSVYTNGAKILSAKQGGGTLTAVNGIRFISMTWVILGHTFAFGLNTTENLNEIFVKYIKRKSFMAIINAEVSVDTFFALSGTLLTYVVLKQLSKAKGKMNWAMFYFHRYWRLTPPLMLVLMIQVCLASYLGSGPLWQQGGFEKDYCKTTWYWNLLYINNFKSGGDECFAHSWYLANDMQFYVISPLILWALYKSKIAGTIVIVLLWIGHAIACAVLTVHYDLGVNPFGRNAGVYFDKFYQMPHTRIGPYLVGMYTGYILYKTNCKVRINKYLNLFMWLVFAASACAVLYGIYDEFNGNPMSVTAAAAYNVLHKTVWGMAICWVIFACATGNGGFINTILSWKGIVPLSRMTYCAYLVHPMVQYYFYYSRKRLIYWDDHQVIYEFFAHLVAAYSVAFIASLGFESPMMALEKVVFKRGGSK